MASLVKSGNYGVVNTADAETNVFYIIKFISEAYMLQNYNNLWTKYFCGRISYQGKYICSMQEIIIGVGINNH